MTRSSLAPRTSLGARYDLLYAKSRVALSLADGSARLDDVLALQSQCALDGDNQCRHLVTRELEQRRLRR